LTRNVLSTARARERNGLRVEDHNNGRDFHGVG
jgi:hypothetical protein